jgi:diacylglycerol kinase (ATP)
VSKFKEKRSFTDSINDALNGIIAAIVNERNIRIDFTIGILVFLASIFLGLSRTEILIICLVVGVVIAAEMINTALENTVDLITKEYDPKIKFIKDTSAGAVLILAFVAIIIGYGIFFDKLNFVLENTLNLISGLPLHISFATLLIVIMSVIFIKAITKTGTPLKGGLPSGHAAVAASVVVIIWILTKNIWVFIMSAILAILVIHSRVESKIHTIGESLWGAIIGTLISTIIFGLCKFFQII